MAKPKLTKRNVFTIAFLSVITLGIYLIFWTNKTKTELKKLEVENPITDWFLYCYSTIWIIGLVFYILSLFNLHLIGDVDNLRISGISALIVAFAFLIMICFEYKKTLDSKLNYDGLDTKLSGFFTLIFSPFYIQYEMNRILARKESKPRKGPIVCAIVLFAVILPLVLILTLIKALF